MESLTEEDPPSLGGYELRARLGEGGFGLVYLALSPGGRAVAIKVLRREFARDREFLGRFQLEVAAAQRVNGIYTAPVVASGLGDRPPWVATAFVPGPPLNYIVSRSGPLPEPALWRLLAGLVEALQAIHACGIVHRDLKPANVLLAADGPRVIDFGISKAVDGTSLTSTGAVFGTPGFMAPEQAEGKAAGPATDVFALGCILAYASTGAPPFGGGSVASVLYRIVHSAPILDGIPPYLRGIVEMCLAKDSTARPSLNDLASIGRDGPDGRHAGHSAASFWPPPFARLIREYQDRLDVTITTGKMADGHSSAHFAPHARSLADAWHPPTAASATPPGSDLPGGGSAADYADGHMRRVVARPDIWQPQGALPYSQPPPAPFRPTPQLQQPPVRQTGLRANTALPAVPSTVRSASALMVVGASLAALTAISVLLGLGPQGFAKVVGGV
jgi:serine/threonine kinase PknH